MVRKVVKYFEVRTNEDKIGTRVFSYEMHRIKRTTIYFLFIPVYRKDETVNIEKFRPIF